MDAQTSTTTLARKKFNILSEVRRNLTRYRQHIQHGFEIVPDPKVVKQITKDYLEQNLMVGGRVWEVPYTRDEILTYITCLPRPIQKDLPTGKKLSSVPVFFLNFESDSILARRAKLQTPLMRFKKGPYNFFQLHQRYEQCERDHKLYESHHPDGLGWSAGILSTIECVFDVFNSLLRTCGIQTAYDRLLDLLRTDKFANLDPSGIYGALLHIHIRGVASSRELRQSAVWRSSRDSCERYHLHRLFLAGDSDALRKTSIFRQYLEETFLHRKCIETELQRFRYPHSHDKTKFQPYMVYFYAWRWGVFEGMSAVDKHRAKSGCEKCEDEIFIGQETMLSSVLKSAGSSFAEGAAETGFSQEQLDKIKPIIKESLVEAGNELRERVREDVHEEMEAFTSEARDIIQEAAGSAKEISEETVSRASTLVEKLSNSLDSVTTCFDSLKSTIADFFKKCVQGLGDLPGMCGIKLDAGVIFSVVKDYILYINVESKLLRSVLVISMLRSLGLLDIGYKYLGTLWGYLIPTLPDDSEHLGEGHETSGMFSYMTSSITTLIHMVGGMMGSVAKGAALTASQFWNLIEKLVPPMKQLHFLGGGVLGLNRIFDFIKNLFTTVVDWVKTNVFKIDTDLQKAAKEVVLLLTKVRYFDSEAGYNAIRMNAKMREKASELFPQWLALSAKYGSEGEYRHLAADLSRHRKAVKDIHDYITRLEAASSFVPTMFHVQFVGEPGVGKSFLTKEFCDNIQKTLWPEEPKASMYSYNPNLEYFDGYSGQKIFYVDDVFRMDDPTHLTTLIGLVTNTPVILPMANLNEKGTQLTSDVMISTTNTAWPVGKDVLCMEAVHRRRHMLVEVEIDPRVKDPSTGQFCMTRYLKHYTKEELKNLPHLKFNLLRPVPAERKDIENYHHTTVGEFETLQDYARELRNANTLISVPGQKLEDPRYYFSEWNKPPEGFTLPCRGWTYNQMLHNFVARYRAFRGMEQSYSTRRKYYHAEMAVAEIEKLFSQEHDICDPSAVLIPTEGKLAIHKVIRRYFSDVHHPYGMSDEVGEKLVQQEEANAGTISPELDKIAESFEDIVTSILDEQSDGSSSETSGVFVGKETTLTAEREALQFIRRNLRCKTPEEACIRDRMKLEQRAGKWVIPMRDYFTYWDEMECKRPISPKMLGSRYIHMTWEREMMEKQFDVAYYSHFYPTRWQSKKTEFNCELYSTMFSCDAYCPNDECFGPIAGTKTHLAISFLHRMEEISGEWVMNVHDLIPEETIAVPTITVKKEGVSHNIPMDLAWLFSTSHAYRRMIEEFRSFTHEQQCKLVEDAKWRNQFTGFYKLEEIRRSCKSIIGRGCIRAVEILLSPMEYLLRKMPKLCLGVMRLSVFLAVAWSLKSLASLLMGTHRGYETSKYLHRGAPSHIQYHGKLTSRQVQNPTESWTRSLLDRNVREVSVSDFYTTNVCQVLCTRQFLVFNAHVLRNLTGEHFSFVIRNPGTSSEIRLVIPRTHIQLHSDGDLAIAYHRSMPSFRDIMSSLITEEEFERTEFTNRFMLLSRFNNEAQIEYHNYVRTFMRPVSLTTSDNTSVSTMDRAVIFQGHSVLGKSGSTAVYEDHQATPKILGIQAWTIGKSFGSQIAIQVLTKELIQGLQKQLLERIGETPIERLGDYDGSVDGVPAIFTSRTANQVVMKLPKQEALGFVQRSQFRRSPIATHMDTDGYTSNSVPAALTDNDDRLVNKQISPLNHSISKYIRGTVSEFDPGLSSYIRKGLGMWISSSLDKNHFRKLTFPEIITGTREDGSNPMNLTTSPGVPYVYTREGKGKTDFFRISEEGYLEYFDPNIYDEYQLFIKSLRQKRVPLTRAYDFPKDELRPREKALGTDSSPPKTRTVTCMNMLYILAWREVSLDFWSAMHRAADGTFPFCPGINPDGPEWSNAYHYINKHPNVVDFDVSNWDGFLPPWLLYLAGDIMCDVMNLSIADRNVIMSILFEVANSYIQCREFIYQKFRGMVSGFPGTAEMNSLVHWILILYIYLMRTQDHIEFHSIQAFRENVSCLVYGDDIIISFSDKLLGIFDGITIAEGYTNLGYPVTAADKTGEIKQTKDISECQFLKSTWRKLHYSIYIREMSEDVALNLLYWLRSKEHPILQFGSNVLDALRIMFGHGEQKFTEFVTRVNRWLVAAGLAPTCYTYEDFYLDHISRYYRMDGV